MNYRGFKVLVIAKPEYEYNLFQGPIFGLKDELTAYRSRKDPESPLRKLGAKLKIAPHKFFYNGNKKNYLF
jgi:hypothetical protein